MSASATPLSLRARQTADQPISYFMQQAVENPNLISLAAGLVDAATLPTEETRAALQEILRRPEAGQAALQYGTTQGYQPLRAKLLDRMAALDDQSPREIGLTENDVVITTGSQQLLYVVGEMLIDPGDIVITEAPSYFVFHGTLASLGARILAVPMDDEGMNTDALEALLVRLEKSGELGRVRLIYTVDYFQNPSGRTLSLQRRSHLLELVQRFSKQQRIFILEDAAYRELRYDGPDLPSIKSLDAGNRHVILAMTFSKPWAPGFKTGYGLLPRDLMAPFLRLKGNHDFGSNNLMQHVLLRLLDNGAYDRHVAVLCDVYREKRDTMLDALAEEFHGRYDWADVHWTQPVGGLFVWLTLPPTMDAGPKGQLMPAALREEVLYVPGQFCQLNDANTSLANEARLSFGVAAPDQLREGVRRLARAAASVAGRAERRAFSSKESFATEAAAISIRQSDDR